MSENDLIEQIESLKTIRIEIIIENFIFHFRDVEIYGFELLCYLSFFKRSN